MALTTAQQVRLRLNDPWRYAQETQYGDGSGSALKLQQGAPYSTIISATASILWSANSGWSATASTIDAALGTMVLDGVISAHTAIQMDYQWAVFSDDEIEYFTAAGGDTRGAALMGVRTLMGNAWKRARWAAPDGSQYDDSKAMQNLMRWESALIAERTVEDGPAGSFVNWAETQADY